MHPAAPLATVVKANAAHTKHEYTNGKHMNGVSDNPLSSSFATSSSAHSSNGIAPMPSSPSPPPISAAEWAKQYECPPDWPPRAEPIDLAVHDMPHASSSTEWWYFNGHVTDDKTHKHYSFFASFFRLMTHRDEHDTPVYAHALNWAIVDVENKKYYADPVLDRSAPHILRRQLEDGSFGLDKRLTVAMLEVVNKDRVPLPDRMFEGEVTVNTSGHDMRLRYHDNSVTKDERGQYHLHCVNKAKKIELDITLTPTKQAVRQAHDGIVRVGIKQETMFYYFIPRNECTGSMTVDGVPITVSGSAWYDHEFGGNTQSNLSNGIDNGHQRTYAWNWVSMQLSNGVDLTATHLVDIQTSNVLDNFALIIDTDSSRREYFDMSLDAVQSYTSLRTTNDYPTQWTLTVPSANIALTLTAEFDEQEFITLISKPAFWEGRINITGTIDGVTVSGVGFVERHGFGSIKSLDLFFKRMTKQVIAAIDIALPHNPNYSQTRNLLASDSFDHLMDGVNIDIFRRTIIAPLREMIDRGGKSWRSFACLLCIDVVGGNSTRFRSWLAMPEIMHVGSLIVDDIQDKSDTRRGGPSCHLIYGEPIAINAGSIAYFISLHVLQSMMKPKLTDEQRARIYDIYFLTMRAGHCGQAFDIYGMDYMMDKVVENGDANNELERAVLATHRLKSAVPAGCLARMGAFVGGAAEPQIESLGLYFESVGLAFQIIDDVLNLRGFEGNTKQRGEDITAGKVTFPIAMAMKSEYSTLEQRQQIWCGVASKPQKSEDIDAVIQIVDQCSGLDRSMEYADTLVESAWSRMDPLIPDSFHKMMLRAFGFYVLQRHY